MRQKIYAYIEDEFSIFHDFMWKWSSMLNYLWAAMIVIGIVYGAFTGNMTAVSDGALDSAKEAVTLCITMLGVMSLWTGLMEIANRSGLIDKMYQSDSAIDAVAVSGCTKRPRCDAAYYHQRHRQFFRAWLGGDTGGTACNESAFRVKRGKQPRQHRYVYLSCN